MRVRRFQSSARDSLERSFFFFSFFFLSLGTDVIARTVQFAAYHRVSFGALDNNRFSKGEAGRNDSIEDDSLKNGDSSLIRGRGVRKLSKVRETSESHVCI